MKEQVGYLQHLAKWSLELLKQSCARNSQNAFPMIESNPGAG